MSDAIRHRFATAADGELLAELNHQLIQDEGHRNAMGVAELAERMRGFLSTDYRAIVFEIEDGLLGYALIREQPAFVSIRQFFIRRDLRRRGWGRKCMAILVSEVLPQTKPIVVDALVSNAGALAFWRSIGFCDYSVSLEIYPHLQARPEVGARLSDA